MRGTTSAVYTADFTNVNYFPRVAQLKFQSYYLNPDDILKIQCFPCALSPNELTSLASLFMSSLDTCSS